ncbi:hypothetical protein PCASD_00556 [Puccinia coronata f. sp. avenae]|uniref:Core-binding (CB) domain-containing protein n=1 Tax=Puccinia coronata f. sp. avenae TaxID=200324 RepID=A0A2N5VNT0_9BASI|nr:hypothetical protein PCASD_00556 [Puccinia coronata f. sp. avenae]
MPSNKFLSTICDFLSKGNTTHPPSGVDQHCLGGWSKSTLSSYNSAVRKFLCFTRARSSTTFDLPATADNIHKFCTWAGHGPHSGNKPVLATTLTKYLCGLCAWHVFHNQQYPSLSNKKSALLLKSSAKLDAQEGSSRDLAVLETALVAFWGCARLSEVTYRTNWLTGTGGAGVLLRDVTWGPEEDWARITLRKAKTALPGELQYIRVDCIPNCLCPVAALRQLANSRLEASSLLFGFQDHQLQSALTKYMVTTKLGDVWRDLG